MSSGRHYSLLPILLLYALTALIGNNGLWLAMLAPPLIWSSLSDLRKQIIPDEASFAIATLGLARPIWVGSWPDPITLTASVALVLCLGVLGELYWRRHGAEALGLGDVKLIGAGVLVVGATQVWFMVLLATCGGIVAAVLQGRHADKGIPFGPFLAYAIYVVAAFTGVEAQV